MSITWAFVLWSVAGLVSVTRADWDLVLAHSNDILSQLDQITDDYNQCPSNNAGQCYGGVARHLYKANQLKEESSGKNEVFLHLYAGSMLGGSIWFPVLGSEPMANATSYLGYNAVAMGYRDFDEGISSASEYFHKLKNQTIKVVCANADFSQEPSFKDLIQANYIINPRDNIKIGIIGFIGADADYLADTGKIQFSDEAAAIQRNIDQMKKDSGVNFFIALGSAGFTKGKEILEKVSDLDILVNGGSNTFLYKGTPPSSIDKAIEEYPYKIESNGNKRFLVQVPRYGKYLGILKVSVSDDGRLKNVKGESNPQRLDGQQETQLGSFVTEWASKVSSVANKVLGKTLVPLVSARETCWKEECNAAALIADAALWFLNSNSSSTQWKDAVAAVVWHGGALVRTNLTIAAGEVRFGDILAMFPFANTLAHVQLKGDIVRQLFETSVESLKDTAVKSSGEFLHVAGARVEYDLSQPKGSLVRRILIRDPSSKNADLVPLDDTKTYKIGMPSFIARGGSRYQFLENIDHVDTGVRDEDVLKDYISFMKVITTGTEDRIDFVTPQSCWVDQTGTVFLTIFLTLLFSGIIYWIIFYGYPKLRTRSGSLANLVR